MCFFDLLFSQPKECATSAPLPLYQPFQFSSTGYQFGANFKRFVFQSNGLAWLQGNASTKLKNKKRGDVY